MCCTNNNKNFNRDSIYLIISLSPCSRETFVTADTTSFHHHKFDNFLIIMFYLQIPFPSSPFYNTPITDLY